ncbi:MAG: autotransporter domain-containing protein [Gammaproteobacteria bacterium]
MSAFKQSFCGALLSVTAVLQPGPADAQDLRVTRHIGESITRRLTQATLPGAEGRKIEDPTTGWIAPSYTTIDFNDLDANIDIYQFVGGIDKRLGSFYAGASAGYARTEPEFFGLESGMDNASFSPYAAYLINDNVFVAGIAGYAREEFDDDDDRSLLNIDPSADTAFTDLSVTGVLPLSQWVVTGRAGHRFAYTKLVDVPCVFVIDDFGIPVAIDDDSFVNTLYVAAEVGYRVDRFLPYFRTIYEHLIPDELDNSELVFVGVGATYDVSDTVSAGLSYQTELNHLDTSNFHQAVLDLRLRF